MKDATEGANYDKGEPCAKTDSVNPDMIDDAWKDLFDEILSCVDDEDTRDTLEEEFPSATLLLVHFETKRKQILASSNNYGQDVRDQFDNLFVVGLASPDIATFNTLKSEAKKLQKQLSDTTCPVPDQQHCRLLHQGVAASAVRDDAESHHECAVA